MKARVCLRSVSILFTFVCLLNGGVSFAQGQTTPFYVRFWYPTNGESFIGPTNIGVHALVTDSNVVETMQYFSGTNSIGIVTNTSGILLTNTTQDSPFYMLWSNVTAGMYTLTAVATDSAGATATSAPVTIIVTNSPPPVIRPAVYIYSPTNNSKYVAPTNLTIYARAVESGGTVATVTFLANSAILGVVSNSSQAVYTNISSEPLFALPWTNVPLGSYALRAIATDLLGNSATSSVVTISVVSNTPPPPVPFFVGFYYPTNGESFAGPTNIGVHALVTDSNVVKTVQYFSGTTSIGIVTNTAGVLLTNSTQGNPFFLSWSNVTAGMYTLTAVATDSAGATATSAPVTINVTNSPPPVIRPAVYIYSPTNNSRYIAPANLTIYARAAESGGTVATVTFLANSSILGVVSNSSQAVYTNISSEPLFALPWTNVPVGSYGLRAIATDLLGNSATSSVVTISVVSNTPPPPVPFFVGFYYPTNGESFAAPANVGVHALVTDSNVVETVQYFSGANSIGVVTNTSGVILTNSTQGNPFFLSWSNVTAGTYTLTAVATDSTGATATSAPVTITVTNGPPVPFTVGFWYPTNEQIFLAPGNVGVHARVTDSNVVETVQYFSGATSIGIVTNTTGVLLTNSTQGNPFFLSWSNVPAGMYALTAVATDSASATATSAPVIIWVVTNLPPVVSIFAPDPVAIEGTNWGPPYTPPTSFTNYVSGTNTATFLVRRNSGTNADLTVYYSIGGTATNGIDYVTIPDEVTIPAGMGYALITIVPLNGNDSPYRRYDSVILSLLPPPVTNLPPTYAIGSPASVGAIILEDNYIPMLTPLVHTLADSSVHLSLPATNGMNFCLEVSTDLVNWQPVCTNTVLKSSAQYVDPGAGTNTGLFYRIVPVSGPPSY